MKDKISTKLGNFTLKESVTYPNGGISDFFVLNDTAIIIDRNICKSDPSCRLFAYSMLTNKQNEYMSSYRHVYRLLQEDMGEIDQILSRQDSDVEYAFRQNDRANYAEVSPLEFNFEKAFTDVYGSESAKYLWKEYGITDDNGKTRYLDYYIRTADGEIAVEENGVHYHHPQEIGLKRYRDQLQKQNLCTRRGIKLFRFSSEDCGFTDRLEDDIRAYFGTDAHGFQARGLLVDRPVVLYDHQQNTLEEMERQRKQGIQSFLIVYPTASGKSKIVEEDIRVFDREQADAEFLILVPNRVIEQDWQERIAVSLRDLKDRILVRTYAWMERHYAEYPQDCFQYVVVDEAHHAVAPGLKRTIQYFQPMFLVGLTATDQRPDRKKLETIFGTYQVGMSLQEAMEKGIIAHANAYRIETNIDLSHVRINGKDYVNADLEKSIRVSSRNELIADVIKTYFCEGEIAKRQGIVFCVNVQHAEEMERLLNASGISAKAYSSKSRDPEGIMTDFRNHNIRFLCSCQMISEGWDYPELGILIMARPTLSKVLYLQQLGRGLRKTPSKQNVLVVDVVDEYGSMVAPCTLHSIFHNPYYVPWGDIARRNYQAGDLIVIDGMQERVERIVEIDTSSFEEKYGNYLGEEQLAREFFLNTGTIHSWIKNKKITPTVSFPLGSRQINMFSPEDTERIRTKLQILVHNDETIRDDFFHFLEERDYSFSYKMIFLLSLLDRMNESGDASIDEVLADYTAFYRDRIDRGVPVDRKNCPFTVDTLKDEKYMKRNMLTNPFEKFERKRFHYYSKDLNIISMNHALHMRLSQDDYGRVREQMRQDLKDYYARIG